MVTMESSTNKNKQKKITTGLYDNFCNVEGIVSKVTQTCNIIVMILATVFTLAWMCTRLVAQSQFVHFPPRLPLHSRSWGRRRQRTPVRSRGRSS